MKSIYKKLIILLVIITLCPLNASANAGLPTIFLIGPFYFFLFIPIVLLEAYTIKRNLAIGYTDSMATSFCSNVFSTLVGVPLTWVLLLLLGHNGIGNFFPDVLSNKSTFLDHLFFLFKQTTWSIDAPMPPLYPILSFTLLFIIFYFVSVWSECLIYRRMRVLKKYNQNTLKNVALKANLISYALIIGVVWCMFLFSYITHQ